MGHRVKAVTIVALLVCVALAAIDVIHDRGDVDTAALGLLALALLLAFGLAAPTTVGGLIERIDVFKIPGIFEVSLRATDRAERIVARTIAADDDVKTEPRSGKGDARQQYTEVREKLEDRIQYVRDGLFEMPKDSTHGQVIEKIREKGLLDEEELALVGDLCGGLEDKIQQMPEALRQNFLDSGWRFSKRFGTLIFERLARKQLIRNGWFLFDFEQKRSHRPDFLAHRAGEWRLIATRVEPWNSEDTRKRLHRLEGLPWEATPTLVLPDRRADKTPADEFRNPPDIVGLSVLAPRS